jgi:hypothetical protein
MKRDTEMKYVIIDLGRNEILRRKFDNEEEASNYSLYLQLNGRPGLYLVTESNSDKVYALD